MNNDKQFDNSAANETRIKPSTLNSKKHLHNAGDSRANTISVSRTTKKQSLQAQSTMQ